MPFSDCRSGLGDRKTMSVIQKAELSDIREIRDRLTVDLRRLIRPELEAEGRAGPYILLAGVDPGITINEDIRGLTCPSMGEIYRDSIERYEGPGPAMILNPNVPIAEIVGTVSHEITHRLMAPTLCCDLPSQAYAVAARECIGQVEWEDFSPEAETLEGELIAAREDHSLAFIRMAIHTSCRLCEMGWPLDTFQMLSWREVTNTRSFEFFDCLRDECYDLRNEPLSAIKSIPPPLRLNSLFEPPGNFRPLFGEIRDETV